MTDKRRILFSLISILPFLFFLGCLNEDRTPSVNLIELSLFTGIPGVARLGDSPKMVNENALYTFTESKIEPESDMGKLGILSVFTFKEIGARVYFKRDGAVMITAQ